MWDALQSVAAILGCFALGYYLGRAFVWLFF